MTDVIIENPMENKRIVNFSGKTVELNRLDPHGLWYFKWSQGEPPEVLSGAFTSVSSAIEFLKNYIVAQDKKPRKAA